MAHKKIIELGDSEVIISDSKYQSNVPQLKVHPLYAINTKAQFMLALIDNHMDFDHTAEDIVKHCYNITEETYAMLEQKNWIFKLPSSAEFTDEN